MGGCGGPSAPGLGGEVLVQLGYAMQLGATGAVLLPVPAVPVIAVAAVRGHAVDL